MIRRPRVSETFAKASAALMVACALIVAMAGAASAHDPIILTDQQVTPTAGPLLMDGTISFAVYGTITAPGDTRGFRARFAAGDTFVLTALVPDLAPERTFSQTELPTISVVTPSGKTSTLAAGAITTFAEPFSNTNYRRYLEWSAPAEAGVYGISIRGSVPARFTVSIGVEERFGTDVRDVPNRSAGVAGVMQWYNTPPPSVASTTSVAPKPVTTFASSTSEQPSTDSSATAPSSDGSSGGSAVWILVIVGVAIAGAAIGQRLRQRRSHVEQGAPSTGEQ